MSNNNGGSPDNIREETATKVLREIGALAKRLDALLVPGQTYRVTVPASNLLSIHRQNSIVIISKPSIQVDMEVTNAERI